MKSSLRLVFFSAALCIGAFAQTPEKTFAELKISSTEGHPWRVPVEDWDGARRKISEDPGWAAWLAKEKSGVDGWIARRHDRVAWTCGWFHDFVSPRDGSTLTWTAAVPGEDVAFLASPSDPQVGITPKIMGGWVFFFRSHHADMMLRAAALYRLTRDEKYAAWAASQLDFYAEHYLEWKVSDRDGAARLYAQTLDEATNGIKYINTVRLLDSYPAPERRRLWWDRFFRPEAAALNRTFQSIHNIAVWQRCAAAQFALVYGDDPLWRQSLDGPFGLRAQLARGITADSLWYEQSFHYNQYVVQALVSFFTQAGLAGKTAGLDHELAVAENLMLAPLYVRFPGGLLPNPADGTGIEKCPDRTFLASTCRVFPTALGLNAARAIRNWDTLVDPPPAPTAPETLPTVTSRSMEYSRMALLVLGPWQVFFHYGQLTRSHAQDEALNFSASFNGIDVTHDPGTVGYGSPFHRDYYARGLNHNLPLVDGEGELPPQPGELITFSPETASVSASQPRYRPGISATRTLHIEGDRLVDVATLRSLSASPHRLGLALHLQGKAHLPAGFTADPDFASERPASFRYWREITKTTATDKISVDVAFGATLMRVTFLCPGSFTLWHGSSPDVPPARREAFYLETRGAETTFTTMIEPTPATGPDPVR